jgi:uncharacterized protein
VIAIVPPEPADVASPCTGVCVIGADDLCDGCFRTLAEIAGWSTATHAERRAILATPPERAKAR